MARGLHPSSHQTEAQEGNFDRGPGKGGEQFWFLAFQNGTDLPYIPFRKMSRSLLTFTQKRLDIISSMIYSQKLENLMAWGAVILTF